MILTASFAVSSCSLLEESSYTITFYNTYNETTKKYTDKLWSGKFASGEQIVYGGEAPTKASDDDYSYEFIGWDHELGSASKKDNYYAIYSKTAITHTYTLVEGQAPTCETDGYKNYYQREDGKFYEDGGEEFKPAKIQTKYSEIVEN